MDAQAQQLRWRCRRGMRELDALLSGFVEDVYPSLSSDDQARFVGLLDLPDPDLHACLIGRQVVADPEVAALLERIRASRRD